MNHSKDIAYVAIIILLLGALFQVKTCGNGEVERTIAQLERKIQNHEAQAEVQQEKIERHADSVKLYRGLYIADSSLLAALRSERDSIKSLLAVVKVKVATHQVDKSLSADSIVNRFIAVTKPECHQDSATGYCIADSANISIGRLISATQKIETSGLLLEQINIMQRDRFAADQQQDVCTRAIEALNGELVQTKSIAAARDTINQEQYKQIDALRSIIKEHPKRATRKTIGWTVGGFTLGVAATSLAILLIQR